MVRETAKICSVNDLLVGEYVVQEGWLPNYIKINDRKLSRVNIMGSPVLTVESKTFPLVNFPV